MRMLNDFVMEMLTYGHWIKVAFQQEELADIPGLINNATVKEFNLEEVEPVI
jgi:hypothetical protein